MKKLFALASMMAVLSVSAQQGRMDRQDGRRVVEVREQSQFKKQDQKDDFFRKYQKYDLSFAQQKELKELSKSYERELKRIDKRDGRALAKLDAQFEQRVERVLSKRQLAQYKQDQRYDQKYYAYQQYRK